MSELEEETKNQIIEKYIARKSFKSKISYLIILGVALALAVVFLVLTCLQVSVKPKFLSEGEVSHYYVSLNGETATYHEDLEPEKFEDITKALNNAFSMSLLTQIFTGQASGYTIGNGETTVKFNNVASIVGSNYFQVELKQEYTVLTSGGDVYQSILNKDLEKLTFHSYYIALPEENGFQDVTIYIPVYGNYYDDLARKYDASVPTVTKITVNANAYGLTNVLTSILEG